VIISAVLRASLAFKAEHVEWLGRQVARVYPNVEFVPFSDVPLSIPYRRLEDGLPTWWSKMEALKKLPDGPVMMVDLDTVFTRTIDLPAPPDGFAYMQASPRNVDQLWGGIQISSPAFRRAVTEHFYEDPQKRIEECNGCDQRYYHENHRKRLKILNVVRPDAVVSYKLHVLQHGLQPENAIVMFHGLPRPWHVEFPWVPPLTPPTE
jgi:hypothetical protein